MNRLLFLLALLVAAFVLWPGKANRAPVKEHSTPIPRLLKESSLRVPPVGPPTELGRAQPDKPKRSGH